MDFYSRMVRLLKVLLPLAALGLLSTVFLISRSIGPNTELPFAETDIAERLRGRQVTKPYFSGTTATGEEITVTASLARPGGEDAPAVAVDLNAWIKLTDDRVITLVSDAGKIHMEKSGAFFLAIFLFTSTEATRVKPDDLSPAFSGFAANPRGKVVGTGIIGDFTAGNMDITTKKEDGPVHMLFKNGVKLVYQPQNSER